MVNFKSVHLDDINIDILNPRFLPQDTAEKEIIKILSDERLFILMSDIAEKGLDPSENVLLSQKQGESKFTVHEGNRRITAVKILNNPENVPKRLDNRAKIIEKVMRIKSKFNYTPIKTIQASIINETEKLRHFIKLKHTGSNNGAGRLRWDAESIERFNQDPFQMELLKLIVKILPDQDSNYNFSTIRDRIVTDPNMRNFFSMKINKPNINFETEEGFNRFKDVVFGLANKEFRVSNFYSKLDRLAFIKNHDNSLIVNPIDNGTGDISGGVGTTGRGEVPTIKEVGITGGGEVPIIKEVGITGRVKVPTIKEVESIPTDEGTDSTEVTAVATVGGRPKKRPEEYDTLIPAYYFKNRYNKNKRINDSIYELRQIEYKKCKISSMYLLRSVLESYVHEYIDLFANLDYNNSLKLSGINGSRSKRNKELSKLLTDHIAIHLQKDAINEEAMGDFIINTFASTNNTSLNKILNHYIHSHTAGPEDSEILSAWEKIHSIINVLDKLIISNSGQS